MNRKFISCWATWSHRLPAFPAIIARRVWESIEDGTWVPHSLTCSPQAVPNEEMTFTHSEFSKAIGKLENAIAQPKTEFLRDSVIQRFEFSVELAWKSAKRKMGTSTSAPKDVIREMAQNNYIQNVEVWLRAIDMRNLTSHTYKEDLAEQVYTFAVAFVPELKALGNRLGQSA